MKKIIILSLIFLLTGTGMLASNVEFPDHKNFRNPKKGNEFGAAESKAEVENLADKDENLVVINRYSSSKFYKRNNLNYNNVELVLKDLQTKAIKNSAVVMLNIVSKE